MATKKKSRTRSRAGATVGVIVILIVLILGGFAIWLTLETDGFTKSQYLTYGGQKIETGTRVDMTAGENKFEIEKAHPFAEIGDYTVTVTANTEADFYYTTSGGVQAYSQLGDVTEMFEIEKQGASFCLILPVGYGMQEFLNECSGETVTLGEMPDADQFIMTVTLSDGKATQVYFSFEYKGGDTRVPVKDVTLDPPHIIF